MRFGLRIIFTRVFHLPPAPCGLFCVSLYVFLCLLSFSTPSTIVMPVVRFVFEFNLI